MDTIFKLNSHSPLYVFFNFFKKISMNTDERNCQCKTTFSEGKNNYKTTPPFRRSTKTSYD